MKRHIIKVLTPQQVMEALAQYIASKNNLPAGTATGGQVLFCYPEAIPLPGAFKHARVEFDYTETPDEE